MLISLQKKITAFFGENKIYFQMLIKMKASADLKESSLILCIYYTRACALQQQNEKPEHSKHKI